MRAVLMHNAGGPEVLTQEEVDTPQLQSPTELLVRLKAAGINPVDTKLRSRGTYYPDRLPTILGCDGAGIVEAVGDRVSRFKPGDEIFFCNGGIGGHSGNYAEMAVVDEAFAARKPAEISFAEAGAAPLVLITAWESMFDRAQLQSGQTALIHAGAGGVGHVAIQLAKSVGAQVITTVGNQSKAEFVRSLGADMAVHYKQEDVVARVTAFTDGIGVDVGFDTVGGQTLDQTFEAVRIYGDVVTLLQPGPEANWKTACLRNQRISLELMLTPMHQSLYEAQKHQGWILAQCAKLMTEDKLKIHVSHQLPLAEAAEAHRLIEAGGMTGKVVLLRNL